MLFFLYVLLYVKIIIAFLPLYAAEAWYFGAPKVPKALCQSSNEPFTQPYTHQKNSDTSFCVQYFFKKIKSSVMNTKPLRFRFVTAIFTVVHLFF